MTKFTKPAAWQKSLIACAMSSFYVFAQAQSVVPPPLPPGSSMVQKHAGMHPEEVKRSQRAHHHSKHHKKDVTRDDTLDEGTHHGDAHHGGAHHASGPKPDTTVKSKAK